MHVSLASVPRVHPETGAQRVGGRWAAASPDGGWHTFEDDDGVSEVGERIMDLVDGKRSVSDIVSLLCEEFEVEREVCASETLKFVSVLVDRQVLQI
jgi:pyrroloquinoline quinone biosynthesis protein D